MNLAEDYFLKKYFPEEFLSQNSEKLKTDATVLFFTEVFRRHHAMNDPINRVDPNGTNAIADQKEETAVDLGRWIYNLFVKSPKDKPLPYTKEDPNMYNVFHPTTTTLPKKSKMSCDPAVSCCGEL